MGDRIPVVERVVAELADDLRLFSIIDRVLVSAVRREGTADQHLDINISLYPLACNLVPLRHRPQAVPAQPVPGPVARAIFSYSRLCFVFFLSYAASKTRI